MNNSNNHLGGLREAKAVWHFTTGDEKLLLDLLGLVLETARSFISAGMAQRFVLLLHGPVMKFVVEDLATTSFATERIKHRAEVHAILAQLAELGVRIEVCRISMRRRGVSEGNLMPFTVVEENVLVSSIALQNQGYALMQVE